ncbi:hypothetical protein POSPLADRAFT_1177860 [Postia placenta MAD-698-R-SB12]|uniref:Uncharacterized protein n=1 Tax=Postia placenta MAD-698-R-SB12 TaxID=670580 RepID=A0A1X6NCK9_9APHY|nr:hypothetical protein POSPLADRAFT_1177860 [Postia placenta MAD-698-R-SB12]OSX66389.1 hypothetical protein POSPLADRAFT_1177860 [Postia placenta MAD-698-R-SB12]
MAGQPVLRMFNFRSRSPAGVKNHPASEPGKQGTADHVVPELHADAPHPEPVTQDAPSSEPAAAPLSAALAAENAKKPQSAPRRFSWMPLSKNGNGDPKPSVKKEVRKTKVAQLPVRPAPLNRTRSEKQAQQSALLLRELIVGPSSNASAKTKTHAMSNAEVEKVKAQLARPQSANKVIAQLRQLSSSDEPVVVGTGPNGETLTALPKGPIHAVCLPYTDAEAHDRHFAQLTKDKAAAAQPATASVANASITTLKTVFSEINLVSLVTTPDLGLGGAPDGPGLLSGALPSAQVIIQGIEQITPQWLALGYATGKAVLPDHAGIYPPTDRMSAVTYWWGFEIILPPPSLQYLQGVPSITHAVINFLTALSLVEGGVREIMPFVRYISSFIDTEFSMIQEQDQGQGVVCAATWLVPAALVPRPWDFAQPPKSSAPSTTAPEDSVEQGTTPTPAPTAPEPNSAPIVVASDKAPSAQTEPTQNVPKVEVTPPTPPASQTLNTAGVSANSGENVTAGDATAPATAPSA